MKKSRFSKSQIIAILKQHENCVSVPDLARKHSFNGATICQWHTNIDETSEGARS